MKTKLPASCATGNRLTPVNRDQDNRLGIALETLATTAKSAASDPGIHAFAGHLAKASIQAIKSGDPILFAGNGGSAADAMHTAAELTGHLVHQRDSLPAIVLGSNPSSMTAIANDYGYQEVFSRELSALAGSRSVLVVFSTSGNSPNIIRVLDRARELGIQAFGFLGGDGGECASLCTHYIVQNATAMTTQEIHMCVAHAVCQMIDDGVND